MLNIYGPIWRVDRPTCSAWVYCDYQLPVIIPVGTGSAFPLYVTWAIITGWRGGGVEGIQSLQFTTRQAQVLQTNRVHFDQ